MGVWFGHDVTVVRTLIDGCCVRARCFKSMKKNDQPHSVGLTLSTSHHEESDSTGSQTSSSRPNGVDIRECLCSCKAGKGDCNHILGLLYLLHHCSKCGFKTVPTVTSKTSQKQTWRIPARTDGITPKKAQDIGIRKICSSISLDDTSNKATSTKRPRIEGIHSTFYNQVSVPLPCNNVYASGLVINPSCSYLGCSPDRKVYDPTANPPYGLLEIKCPSSVDSICDIKCLKLDKQTYKLRQSHDYFFQVMGQMAITGLTWCFHLERIYYSNDKWINMKDKLDIFYF
ncbi:hypothetical protein LOTGIDRAFT_175144 [Lottia gigantea]|uniref:SWIM-type domain-containing protein n=1 Tax=Lottia gigantea TaxID=225164 RepID=V3ZVM8_LOTGI|nr:hypothetical protein LOTGIDRAFT_175144 [Lottia gigantea]ESO95568.1 hypothetical protein LOTGIDRAFT_175144 [Lottia gigantea]